MGQNGEYERLWKPKQVMRMAAVPALVILVAAAAGCSKAETPGAAAALAPFSGTTAPHSAGANPVQAPGGPMEPGSGAPAGSSGGTAGSMATPTGKAASATAAAAVTSPASGTASALSSPPASVPDASPSAPSGPGLSSPSSPPPSPNVRFTHGGPTTGPATPPATPSTSPAAPTAGNCIISDSKMVITVAIPAAAAAWTAGADIDLLEDLSGATQTTRYQVYLAAPLTPGETVTVTESANPLLVSCEAVGVVSVIGASSLLLLRPAAPYVTNAVAAAASLPHQRELLPAFVSVPSHEGHRRIGRRQTE